MLGPECHNFNESRFVMFVVIKFEFLARNQSKPGANGVFVLGDETVNCLPNGRKGDVFGAWRVHVIRVPLREMDKNTVMEAPFRVGKQINLLDRPKFLSLEVG